MRRKCEQEGGKASPSLRPTHSWRRALEMDYVHTTRLSIGYMRFMDAWRAKPSRPEIYGEGDTRALEFLT